jgi:hypothetical protein
VGVGGRGSGFRNLLVVSMQCKQQEDLCTLKYQFVSYYYSVG